MVSSCWFLLKTFHLNSTKLSLWLAPSLGMNSLLCCACGAGIMCLLSTNFLRHFSLVIAGLRAPLSRFLEGALYKYLEWMNEWISYFSFRSTCACLPTSLTDPDKLFLNVKEGGSVSGAYRNDVSRSSQCAIHVDMRTQQMAEMNDVANFQTQKKSYRQTIHL